ncbi:MAG: dihydrodipicolinate synthase family protein [Acetobacteraceae bacterium]|jgi:4-hydroxy-tetrahydrodipicolinate synthase
MQDGIHGFWVAAATPLDATGAIDTKVLGDHARSLFARGCDGVVLFGTTGEGPSFTAAERIAAVHALLGQAVGPDRLALGVGFPAMHDAAGLCRDALALGLTQVLALPPFFFRDVTEDGLVDAFASLLDRVNDDRLRLTLYNIPQVSGVAVPPGTAARLRERYGHLVAGVKDSSGDFAQFRAFRAAAPDLAITTGSEPDIGRALAEGGAGTICGMGNVAPDLVRAMFRPHPPVQQMQAACGLISGPFIALLKAMLAAQTNQPGWLRVCPPLRPATLADGTRLLAQLDALTRQSAA